MKFEELNIDSKINKSLKELGYVELTKIQEEALPCILDGKDVVAQSKTGTGKTAAFSIPIINEIDTKKSELQSLVLCPTRELAIQVEGEILKYSKYIKDLKVLCIYGGQELKKQIIPLRRGVHIVVATPGRIIDHIKRKTIKLDSIQKVVLDEADEMLNMGFEEDVSSILNKIGKKRQTLLFSATITDKIRNIVDRYTNNPKSIIISENELVVNDIKQFAVDIKAKMKNDAVCRFIDEYIPNKTIIFCNTKKKVSELSNYLNKIGYNSIEIHSDIRQEQRSISMKRFKENKVNILVATDVASRGIDVLNVDLVINYDVPDENEIYVHRIGRTGRNKNKGISITFTVGKEKNRLEDIANFARCNIEYINVPPLKGKVKMENSVNVEKINYMIKNNDFSHDLELFNQICKNNNNDYEKIAKAMYSLLFKNENKDTNIKEENKFITLFFNAGKEDNIKAKDIVGAIANNTALKGTDIGKIDVKDKYSFVQIPSKYVDEVMYKLSGDKIKGKKIEIEISK